MDLITFCICLSIIFGLSMSFILALERGWFDNFEIVITIKKYGRILILLAKALIFTRKNKNTVSVSINKSKQSMSICYNVDGAEKLLNVPYNHKNASYMRMYDVYLVIDDKKLPISQPNGIPYMCSAAMLGGDKIIAEHKLKKEYLTFDTNIIPGYLV